MGEGAEGKERELRQMKRPQNVTLDIVYITECKKRGLEISPLLNDLLGRYLDLPVETQQQERTRLIDKVQDQLIEEENTKKCSSAEASFFAEVDLNLAMGNKEYDTYINSKLPIYAKEFGSKINTDIFMFKLQDFRNKADMGEEGYTSLTKKYGL